MISIVLGGGAGALILIYSALVIIGTLISDLLLIALDPRIRIQ